MKKSWLSKEWLMEFGTQLFVVHKIVLGVLMLVMGVTILWLSLGWLIKDPKQSMLFIEGRIVKYELSQKVNAYIMIDPSNANQDSLAERKYFFERFETFDQAKFEKNGGGLNSVVKVGVNCHDLNDLGLVLHQLAYANENYIDSDLNDRLRRENHWYGFIAALIALSIGFGLFKLVGILKVEWKANRSSAL